MRTHSSIVSFAHYIVQAKSILFPSLADIITKRNLGYRCVQFVLEKRLDKFLHNIPSNMEVSSIPPKKGVVLDIQAVLFFRSSGVVSLICN
jgi:hypothetical protein